MGFPGGGLAQLGERDNGIVEATGSSPVSSTTRPFTLCTVDLHGIPTWLADAHRGDIWKKATGRTLGEALRKLVESVTRGSQE